MLNNIVNTDIVSAQRGTVECGVPPLSMGMTTTSAWTKISHLSSPLTST